MNTTIVSAHSAAAVQRPHLTTQVRLFLAVVLAAFFALAVTLSYSSVASAVTTPGVGLGTAGSYSVLGGQTVTNTGTTSLSGALGVSPGTEVTGFTAEQENAANVGGAALQPQADASTAYGVLAAQESDADLTGQDLGGLSLVGGVYSASSSMALTGTLTLDGGVEDGGVSDSVFIFQAGSTLNVASSSNVVLTGGAQACNVYWQVGSSATLGTGSNFVGTIISLASITVQTDATVQGRALALSAGSVTLDSNVFTDASCAAAPTPDAGSPTPTPTPDAGSPTPDADDATTAPAETPTESPVPTGTPTESPTESESAAANPSESRGGSDSRTDSDTPDGSDSPTGSDVPDEYSSGSGAPVESDTDSAEAAAEQSDLPATGPGALTIALVGLSALLILGGATLLIVRQQRSHSSD